MSKFKNLYEALNSVRDTLDWIEENATIPGRDDWEEWKQEELAHDAQEDEKVSLITIEDIRPILVEISRSGRTSEVKALIQKYGCNKLSEVKKEDYKALLEDAKVLQNA